jgi:hypothetical protein
MPLPHPNLALREVRRPPTQHPANKGKYWTIPPEVPYRGYTLKEITLVPAPERLPVEMLAADQAIREAAPHYEENMKNVR